MIEKSLTRSQMMIRTSLVVFLLMGIRYFGEFSVFIDAVESPAHDTSMILSSFEDAVKTYDLTWRIREASEASTRELYGSPDATQTLNATSSTSIPTSLEDSGTPVAGPAATDPSSSGKKSESSGLMESVKEGVEKLGFGSKKDE